MKKIILFAGIVLIVLATIFLYSRNSEPKINYDSFNVVAPGVLRTPDERFKNLLDYPFEPNYLTIGDTRIHYLDVGPRDGKVIYLLHGQPAWSYLFRKMIPTLTQAGYRVELQIWLDLENLINIFQLMIIPIKCMLIK